MYYYKKISISLLATIEEIDTEGFFFRISNENITINYVLHKNAVFQS